MIFSFALKSSKYLLMPTRSTRKEINDRVTNVRHSNKIISNPRQPKPRKFVKECDLSSGGIRSPGAAPSSGCPHSHGRGARAARLQAWWAQTSKRVNSAYCTAHRSVQGSQIASGINRLCFMKPSARICVWMFSPVWL